METQLELDPAAVLDQIDPDAISARLDEIRTEREGLLILLRSARARQHYRPKDKSTPTGVQKPAIATKDTLTRLFAKLDAAIDAMAKRVQALEASRRSDTERKEVARAAH